MGNYCILKSVLSYLNFIGILCNPKYFPQPEAFHAVQILPGSLEKAIQYKCAFLPFGLGAQNCSGYKFTILLVLLTLGSELCAVKVELNKPRLDGVLELKSIVILGTNNGVCLKICKG